MQNELVFALKKFGLTDSVINSNITKLEAMPIDLVNYDKRLPNESQKIADLRKECADVYVPGKEKKLAKVLYAIKPSDGINTKSMLPWEVILYYHNMISSLLRNLLADSKKVNDSIDTEYSKNELINPTSTNDATVSETDNRMNENVMEMMSSKPADESPTSGEMSTENFRETANYEITKQTTASECGINKKETLNMSDIATLMETADAMGQGTLSSTSIEDAAKKKVKPEKLDKDIQTGINQQLSSTREARLSKVQHEHIEMMISTAPAVLDRLVKNKNIKGVLVNPKGANDDLTAKIKAKLDSACSKCYYIPGQKPTPITYEKWLELPDDQKFANVVPDDLETAKAYIDLLLKGKEKPDIEVSLLAPEKRNLNFKGLVVGANAMSKAELTLYLSDFTFGYTYTADSYDDKGQEIADKVVKAQITKVNKRAKNTGVSTQVTARKALSVTLKGRERLIEGNRVKFLFPNVDKETPSTTPLTVALNGKAVSFKYYVRDEKGEQVIVGKAATEKKASTEHPQTRTCTLRGAGAVYAVIKEFAPDLQGSQTPSLAKERWGVSLPAVKETSVFLTDMANSPLYKIAISGDLDRSGLGKSAFFASVNDMVNKKDEEAAAVAAESFNS